MTEQIIAQRYRLVRVLGEGGMARVYQAEDRRLGRLVAVKVLLPQFTGDPEFLRRFEQEGRIAASLSHPNLVGVFDVGQDGQFHYIVMELVDGQTLKEAITRTAPLPIAEAIRIAIEVCAGLTVAHARGLVHRDIKPQNILLTSDGQVKVADFGIARRTASATMTQTGTVLGSVHYLSPEQAQGLDATPRSDLYALGVTMYEMLTGRVPFTADNPVAVAMQQVQAVPVAPRQLNRGIPPALEGVVLRLMAKNPNERFPDAPSVIVALRMVLGQADGSTRVYRPQTAPVAQGTTERIGTDGPTRGFAQPVITQPITPPTVPVQAQSGRRSILAGVLVGGIGALALIAVLAILSSGGSIPGFGSSATATASTTPTAQPSATPTNTHVVPVLVPTHVPTATATASSTKTPRPTASLTPIATVTESASFTPTFTPVPPTATATPTVTATVPPTLTFTPLPSPTPFPTIPIDTPTPPDTATPIPSDTPLPTITAVATFTPLPTAVLSTDTPLPTFAIDTDTPQPTVARDTDTPTPLPTAINTDTPRPTATASETPLPDGTAGTPPPSGSPDRGGTPGAPLPNETPGTPPPGGTVDISGTPPPTATFLG